MLLNGFTVSGATHDVLQFRASAFGAGLSGANPTADWNALVALMTQNSLGQAVVTDLSHDTITIAGVSKSTLSSTANAGDFRFV